VLSSSRSLVPMKAGAVSITSKNSESQPDKEFTMDYSGTSSIVPPSGGLVSGNLMISRMKRKPKEASRPKPGLERSIQDEVNSVAILNFQIVFHSTASAYIYTPHYPLSSVP
jgi:hypothetical protein